jgi:tRNA pseudouridine38-40 synthase
VTLFEPDDLESPSPTPSLPVEDLVRLRACVAYDGSAFHGFAVNEGVPTVAGALADAIGRHVGHGVEIVCAGRTDRGVHGRGQVISFDVARAGLDLALLQRSVNRQVAPAVAIRDLVEAEPGFDARFSALARHYRYLIRNDPVPDPFLASRAWHVEQPLDRYGMELACDPLIGEHDFAAFCRRPKRTDGSTASLVRRVLGARWKDEGDGVLRFEVEATAFCHQMVRSIVGTLVDVGLGRLSAGDVSGILRSADRQRAGRLAPAHGLTLWSVDYDGWSS